MTEASPQTSYRQCALTRLARAEELYRSITPEDRATAFCEMAQVASLIWDAVIDAVTAAYVESGGAPTGRSTEIRVYARNVLPDVYEYWKGPAWLHNFQHRPHRDSNALSNACRYTARLLTLLNRHLPEPLRLPADSFGWLS